MWHVCSHCYPGRFTDDSDDSTNTPIREQEVRDIVRQVAGQHCRRLVGSDHMRDVRLERKYAILIEDNNEVIFYTKTMLMDWIASQPKGINDSEKREKLRNATIAVRGDIWKGGSRFVPPINIVPVLVSVYNYVYPSSMNTIKNSRTVILLPESLK